MEVERVREGGIVKRDDRNVLGQEGKGKGNSRGKCLMQIRV